MKLNQLSVKSLCLLIGAGTLFLMLLLTGLFFALTDEKMILLYGNEEPERLHDSETLFARINHRLSRLYNIMQENRRKVDAERAEL